MCESVEQRPAGAGDSPPAWRGINPPETAPDPIARPARRALMAVALLAAAPLPLGLLTQPARAQTQPLSPEDSADITRIETYLNGLKSLKAHFFQVAGDGGISQGTAWLQRPGHMRFQYDPPAPFLMIASHGVLTFNDSALQQTSNIQLSRTPLGILLADHVALSGGVTVTGIQRLPGQLQITVVRTDSPGDGTLTLIFTDSPLALRQWVVVDAQRRETHVTLSDVQIGASFDPLLFEQLALPHSAGGK